MIDRVARDRLARQLQLLIRGRTTIDDFGRDEPGDCSDEGVKAVWEFGSFLYYESVLPCNCRLQDRPTVPLELLRLAARSILFLRSDAEYEWPPEPEASWSRILLGCGIFFMLPLGVACLIISLALLLSRDFRTQWLTTIPGLCALGLWTWVVWHGSLDGSASGQGPESGDSAVWPFFRRDNYRAAIKNRV